jgi:S1-C subfamily serine protease
VVLELGTESCGETRQATATVVNGPEGRDLITNRHAVIGADTATIHSPDGTVSVEPVTALVEHRDIAILDGHNLEGRGLELGEPPHEGDIVRVTGWPGGTLTTDIGQVISIEPRRSHGGTSDVLVIDTPARAGLSGGAVTNQAGELVGLVVARDPDTGDTVAYQTGDLDQDTTRPTTSCTTPD